MDGIKECLPRTWRYGLQWWWKKNEEDEEDGDGAIDANNYGGDYDLLVFWLKVSISACRGQLGGRNGNESGGRAVAAHPTEVSRIHKPAKSSQQT